MSDDRSPLEQAVEQAMDAFVYAPIGLLFEGTALFPTLVDKGRNQVQTARMMGEMAVKMGQDEAGKRVARTQAQVRETLTAMGLVDADNGPAAGPRPTTRAEEPAGPAPAPTAAAPEPSPPKPPVDELVIPDYDSLSASQVVSRLGGLDSADLDALRAYESATRARKTILNKIAQLQRG